MPIQRTTDDAVGRFLTLTNHFKASAGSFEDWAVMRHAATSLPLLEEAPEKLADGFRDVCAELKRTARWWESTKGSVRYVIAASIVRQATSVAEFLGEAKKASALFRAARLPRGSVSELQAFITLRESSPDGRVTASQVNRMRDLYAEIKKDHPWLLGAGEYPTIALLSTSDTSASEIARRVEGVLKDLESRGFKGRGTLMPPAQLLFLSPDRDTEACNRFEALWREFKRLGLRMHSGDYDEVALLAFLPLDAGRIAQAVLDDRAEINTLRPKPGRDIGFSLACSTAHMRLAGGDKKHKRLAHTQVAIQVRSILASRQAAAAAAAC